MTAMDPIDTFRQEARELLEQLEQSLLDLEQNAGDADLVNSAFRALHTIKGSGAMFGFTEVASFVHEFETAFDKVRKGSVPATPALVAVALDAKDHINQLIEKPDTRSEAGEPILALLRKIVAGEAVAMPEVVPAAEQGWSIAFKLPPDALAFGTNPQLLLGELAAMGEAEITVVTDDVPELEAIDNEACYLGWRIRLHTTATRDMIEDVFLFLRDGMALSIEPLGEQTAAIAEMVDLDSLDVVPVTPAEIIDLLPKPVEQPLVRERPAAANDKAGASLRVPAERLDELMDRVGELVIAQARLTQIAGLSDDLNLKSIAEELERLSSGLRDTTMGIRMVPIGTLFSRFRRLVHDLSHDLGKDIEFITTGEETELDKTMIERLADPLVHIIRNAVDHGLEAAADRTRSGKAPRGTVRLSATYSGAEVAISVSDDGAGLDAARIRAKAIESGLITTDSALSEHDLHQLIFAPGFSTARQVTSLSGRGVGMDVVKRTIDGLRGTIEVTTRPGQGTTVTLRLPLTLAIIDGLLVRIGQGRYTIPLAAVEECVELPAEAGFTQQGRSFLNIRGSLIPFIRLREVFGIDEPAEMHQKVVIVSSGEGRVGLVVDQLLGNNQTVIKQLSKLHSSLKMFSGATILGDGTVALILDAMNLVGQQQTADTQIQTTGRAA